MRSMAHVERIIDISPIEGADAIEVATVLGWKVVVKKNEYKVGDKILYCEIDSWVPLTVAPFLQKNGKVKTYMGVDGEKLRTIRLRGQISQGLVLPLPADMQDCEEGEDLSEAFNIQKWEPPIHPSLAGLVRSNFPSHVKKTVQERIQNCYRTIQKMVERGEIVDEWIIQEKLEGVSMQVAKVGDEIHVLSRTLSLKLDQEGNAYIDAAKQKRLIELIENIETEYPVFSIQGELIGEGIKDNIYQLKGHDFHVFDIWVGDRFLSVPEIIEFRNKVTEQGFELKMVPMFNRVVQGIFSTDLQGVKDILDAAEIKTSIGNNPDQDAEGIVFKNLRNPNVSFKAISNRYLEKSK